jgi:hypothetical protein
MRMIFDLTAILAVTILSIQMSLALNRALLTVVFKAMERMRSADGYNHAK